MSWRAALSSHLQELRLCYKLGDKGHKGLRDFAIKRTWEYQMMNPSFPWYVREIPEDVDMEPYFLVHYDLGQVEQVPVTDLSMDQVEEVLGEFVKMGKNMPKDPVPNPWMRIPHDAITEMGRPDSTEVRLQFDRKCEVLSKETLDDPLNSEQYKDFLARNPLKLPKGFKF